LKGKTIFIDCVGGQYAGKVLNILPNESQLICYGRLSGEDLGGIDLGGLYYQNKVIRGFWLNRWLK
jgi:NADPH:quinone reductase-like Zn-dependent oxidoreductase